MSSPKFYSWSDARALARQRMPRLIFDFVDGATGDDRAAARNRAALAALTLQPRVLAPVQERSLRKTFLGREWGLPFGVAPMGMCNLAWPGTDACLAGEARKRDFPQAVSTAASSTMEEVLERSGGRAWFQLYMGRSLESSLAMVDRAADCGYELLILTVDVPQVARRPRELRSGFRVPFRMGLRQFCDFACHPTWSLSTLMAGTPKMANFKDAGKNDGFVRDASRAGADWDFLARLRDHWKGKLVVKGVLCDEDALGIKEKGADAIYVSNHGGRQLDSAPAAIHALASVRRAVGPDYPLLFDSGIRDGEDVVKALAGGADFVMLGRAFLYAIVAGGAAGLSHYLDFLEEEISTTLAQLGQQNLEDLSKTNFFEEP